MLKRIFEKKIAARTRIGFVFAFCLLLIGNILSFISVERVKQQTRSGVPNAIIEPLDNLLLLITGSESAYRGHLIDSNQDHLKVFDSLSTEIDRTLQLAASSNTSEANLVEGLSRETKRLIEREGSILQDYSRTGAITPQIRSEISEANRMKIQLVSEISSLKQREMELQVAKSQSIFEYVDLIKLISIISTIIAILLTLYSILVFNKENKAKKEAAERAANFREELENRVEDLAKINSELIELRGTEKFVATGRIARTIAHEVRNPLTNINLATEQLKTEFEGSENADLFLDMIERNSKRINKLVSDLLHATKLNELKTQPVSVNDVLDECLSEASDRIKLSHVNVEKHFAPDIPDILVEKDTIKIAFSNLITNGIEAMEQGGTLEVSTRTEDDRCVIKISDTGRGMTDEQMNRLFEPFFTTKEKGNGLGLANTHKIVLSHNGSIQCTTKEGEGTTFTISLGFAN